MTSYSHKLQVKLIARNKQYAIMHHATRPITMIESCYHLNNDNTRVWLPLNRVSQTCYISLQKIFSTKALQNVLLHTADLTLNHISVFNYITPAYQVITNTTIPTMHYLSLPRNESSLTYGWKSESKWQHRLAGNTVDLWDGVQY